MTNGKVFVVIPAAGVGRRMGSSVPKQYLELTESGQTVLAKSIEVILSSVVNAISEGLEEREQEKKNNENQKKEDSNSKVKK